MEYEFHSVFARIYQNAHFATKTWNNLPSELKDLIVNDNFRHILNGFIRENNSFLTNLHGISNMA